jgi:nucleoside triphosphate pyrophosphatase
MPLLFHKVVQLRLILASASAIRSSMLHSAGIEFEVSAPGLDESGLKAKLSEAAAIATGLANAKAESVSRLDPDAWVIGSDSVVSVDGRLFDKPSDRSAAAEHLRFFSGKAMQLTSAVALARGGTADWRHVETATLQVRPLSDAFIEIYLDAEWPEVGYTVGVFRLEGRGVQLFERIEGDHFSILGMPLIPLLEALRERGLLLT